MELLRSHRVMLQPRREHYSKARASTLDSPGTKTGLSSLLPVIGMMQLPNSRVQALLLGPRCA